MTDGNLSSHARRLAEAGMVDIHKMIDEGKPVTRFTLTRAGRSALEGHVRKLLAALSQRRIVTSPPARQAVAAAQEEWVD
jgi:DNA-binding transcriptional ArsR family regulator